jgi:hypothetical protein
MPQGYKNSPAVFQRVMNMLFKDMIGTKCVIYIDDILVIGRSKEEHDANLKSVIDVLGEYGLE